ncbi:hypothetical protein BLSTO_01237, partial [Blastocystis sp. subtype 1]
MSTIEVSLIWNGNLTKLSVLESSSFRQIARAFLCTNPSGLSQCDSDLVHFQHRGAEVNMDDKISALRYMSHPTFLVLKTNRRHPNKPIYAVATKKETIPEVKDGDENALSIEFVDIIKGIRYTQKMPKTVLVRVAESYLLNSLALQGVVSLFTVDGMLVSDLSFASQGIQDQDSIAFIAHDFEYTQDLQLKNIHIPGIYRHSDFSERIKQPFSPFLSDIVFSYTVKTVSALPVILQRLTKYRITTITVTDKVAGIDLHINGLLPPEYSTIKEPTALTFSCVCSLVTSPAGAIVQAMSISSFFSALADFDYSFFHLLTIEYAALPEPGHSELLQALKAQAFPVYVVVNSLPFTPLKGLLDGVNATRQEAQKERQAEQKKLHEMEEKNRGQEVVAQALQAEKQALEQALKEARAQAAGRDALARSCKEMAKQAEAARAAAGEAKKEQAARQLFQSHLLSLRAFFPRVAAIQEDVLRDVQALRASYGEDARLCNIAGAATLSRSMLCGAADTLASLNLDPPRDGAVPAV